MNLNCTLHNYCKSTYCWTQMPIEMDLNIIPPHSPNGDENNPLSFDLTKESKSNSVNINKIEDESNREMDDIELDLHFDELDSKNDIEVETEEITNIVGTPFLHLVHSLLLYFTLFFSFFLNYFCINKMINRTNK